MAVAGVNADADPHVHACYAQRDVDVSAHPLHGGSHLIITVRAAGMPPTVMEYIVDVLPADDALCLGLGYAREFIDGSLH